MGNKSCIVIRNCFWYNAERLIYCAQLFLGNELRNCANRSINAKSRHFLNLFVIRHYEGGRYGTPFQD